MSTIKTNLFLMNTDDTLNVTESNGIQSSSNQKKLMNESSDLEMSLCIQTVKLQDLLSKSASNNIIAKVVDFSPDDSVLLVCNTSNKDKFLLNTNFRLSLMSKKRFDLRIYSRTKKGDQFKTFFILDQRSSDGFGIVTLVSLAKDSKVETIYKLVDSSFTNVDFLANDKQSSRLPLYLYSSEVGISESSFHADDVELVLKTPSLADFELDEVTITRLIRQLTGLQTELRKERSAYNTQKLLAEKLLQTRDFNYCKLLLMSGVFSCSVSYKSSKFSQGDH